MVNLLSRYPLDDDAASDSTVVAYLVVVFGFQFMQCKRNTGTFLNEYFLGSRSMGGIVLAMTPTATYIGASSFIGGLELINRPGVGIAGDDSASCSLASLGILGKVRNSCAPLQCGDAERYAVCRYQSRLLVWLASLSLRLRSLVR